MNERIIKETANEILANLIHKPEWDKPCTEKILESFAELIVKECGDFVYYKAEKSMSREIVHVGDDLLKHFGVDK